MFFIRSQRNGICRSVVRLLQEGKGLVVIGFPCDDFNLQEPGTNATEILNGLKYVRPGNGYEPKFTLTQKIDVNGDKEHSIYTYLKSYCGPTSDTFETADMLHYSPIRVSDVRWNFEAFLITKTGIPAYRYSPDTMPSDLRPDIITLLENNYVFKDNSILKIPY
ncbi:hypothetical protein CHS0354_032076 [Potamilus streckersoni]|uniref:Glutathione peroxidase n=1 Tax=Potamilus streckersoni TaxID=2493646 RepID=A0AAE0TLF2_9BIVA|nr:hypothetical protein CHS0354_032076 [Potamilus streckersoni]